MPYFTRSTFDSNKMEESTFNQEQSIEQYKSEPLSNKSSLFNQLSSGGCLTNSLRSCEQKQTFSNKQVIKPTQKATESSFVPLSTRKDVIIPKLNLGALINPYASLDIVHENQYNSTKNLLISSSSSSFSSSERSIYS